MDPKAVRRSESAMQFGVAAAKQALADSGFEITDENREDVGVIFGSGAGGQQLMIDNWHILQERGPRRVAPTFIANALVDSTSGMIAIETGAIGHNMCIVIGLLDRHPQRRRSAPRLIRRGDCIAVIAGSTETPLLEVGPRRLRQHARLGLAAPGRAHRGHVSRPFDRTRDGFVLGEGAGGLFLEDLELAQGARRADLRRGRGLRLGGRRLGHDPADRGRLGLGAGDEDGARAPRRARPTRST